MKKICTVLLVLVLLSTGCGKTPPALTEISVDTIDTVSAELMDCTRDDLIRAWGEPSGPLIGMYGDLWKLENESPDQGNFLTVYYNMDDTYSSSHISYQITYTGIVTDITVDERKTMSVTVDLGNGETVVLTNWGTVVYGANDLTVGHKATFLCNTTTDSHKLYIHTAEIIE